MISESFTQFGSVAFVSSKHDLKIAGTLFVYDHDTMCALLGGYDSEVKSRGAKSLVYWTAMQFAKQLGLTYFDFEGSMVPSIEAFFRGFGGKLTPYYRINKTTLPLEIILKFFKRELF